MATHRLGHRAAVAHVEAAGDELRMGLDALRVACQRRHLVLAAEQFGEDSGADESGGADQGNFHVVSNDSE
jgi:hypothetical protein